MRLLRILINLLVVLTIPLWIGFVVVYDIFSGDSATGELLSGKKWFWQ